MKMLRLLSLAFLTLSANADLIYESQIDTEGSVTGRHRILIKGDVVRVDMPGSRSAATPDLGKTVFVNLKTGSMEYYFHTEKKHLTTSFAKVERDQKAADDLVRELARKSKSPPPLEFPKPPKPSSAGVTQKVGDWSTEIFVEGDHSHWVSKDFPNHTAVNGELKRLIPFKLLDPWLTELGGMVVRTTIKYAKVRSITTLISARVATPDEKDLTPPKGYTPISKIDELQPEEYETNQPEPVPSVPKR